MRLPSLPRVAAAFAAHEWRTQARSLRFRVLATLYVLAGSAPAALSYVRRTDGMFVLGGASYAGEILAVLPTLTAVFALLISLDAVTREQEERAWSTVSLAGLSSAGYLMRRWLALQGVILPLTLLPMIAGAIAAVAGSGSGAVTAAPFVLPWLLHVAPLAMAVSALALGVGAIAGSTANAFVLLGLTAALVPPLVNGVLARFGFRVDSPMAWIDFRRMGMAVGRMTSSFGSGDVWNFSFPLEMSESPYDPGMAAGQLLARAAVPVALAAAVLGLAALYLRRTRPDVRPLRISPSHPLRTFLGSLARLRERYTPDPVPARADLLALGLALLVAAGASAGVLGRAYHFQETGKARFAAEKAGGPAPTAAGLVPGRWRIEGTAGPARGHRGRQVSLQVTAEMRNRGNEPAGHLAFELNPFVRIESAEAPGGRLALSRSWDRVSVDLTPPIPPGGSRQIRFRLAGEPGETAFNLDGRHGDSFYSLFYGHLQARFGRDLADLSRSYQVPALSRRRVDLAATALTPVPRYHSWKLDGERRVPVETFLPPADLSLSLTVPRDLFLADACGGTARNGRLDSRCRLPLGSLQVAGGRYRVLAGASGGLTVAVYPPHAAQGELHLGFLARGTRKLAEAWPGQGDLRRTVVIEWPEPYVHALDTSLQTMYRRWEDPREQTVRTHGELVLLREMDLIRTRPLDPDNLVARLVAGRLSRRRAVAPEDASLFQNLFTSIVLQRLGLGGDSGATVAGLRPGQEAMVMIPPPKGESYSPHYWNLRFPALLSALQSRMGEEPLRQAVEDVLSREDGGRLLTRDELFAALKARSEVPLDRMIQDFFVEGLLPEPALEGVALRRTANGWTVTGRMVNQGKGEALCKIVLTTDLGPVETVARAGKGEAGAFTLTTAHRPQSVWLDPDRQCHRLVSKVFFADRFYFEGNGG